MDVSACTEAKSHDYETVAPVDAITVTTERCRRCGVLRDTLLPDILFSNGERTNLPPRRRYRVTP